MEFNNSDIPVPFLADTMFTGVPSSLSILVGAKIEISSMLADDESRSALFRIIILLL